MHIQNFKLNHYKGCCSWTLGKDESIVPITIRVSKGIPCGAFCRSTFLSTHFPLKTSRLISIRSSLPLINPISARYSNRHSSASFIAGPLEVRSSNPYLAELHSLKGDHHGILRIRTVYQRESFLRLDWTTRGRPLLH